MRTEIGDYRNELSDLANFLLLYATLPERKYRLVAGPRKGYIFKNLRPVKTFSQRYSKIQLEEILENSTFEDLNKVDKLVTKINLALKLESTDTNFFRKNLDKILKLV